MSGNARTVTVNIVGDSSKLSSATKKAADDTQSATGRISGAWKGVAGTLGGAFGSTLEPIMSVLDGLDGKFEGIGKHAGLMMAGIGGAGLAAGGALTAFGDKEKAADQQLEQTYKNIGANFDEFKGKIKSTSDGMAKYGYTADEVKDGLNQLTAATKNPQQALDLMSTAANLAALKHMSLADAVNMVAQVSQGKGTRALTQLGIANMMVAGSASGVQSAQNTVRTSTEALAAAQKKLADLEAVDHAKKSLTVADQQKLAAARDAVTKSSENLSFAQERLKEQQVALTDPTKAAQANLTALANATKGQASAASDTLTGKLKAVRAEIENHVAEIGQKYGPAIQATAAGMTVLGGATESVSAIMSKFKAADEAVTAAEGVKTVAEGVDTAAEGAEGVAAEMADAASLPLIVTVGLIVAAVAALGVGIYELATHWSTVWNGIKDVTVGVWHGIDDGFIHPIEDFFTGIPKFVEDHWQLLLSILTGPIGAAIIWITTHFGEVLTFFEGVPGALGSALAGVGKAIGNAFIFGINSVIDAWDWLMDHLKIPGFSLGPVHFGGIDLGAAAKIGTIPYLAQGGIVTGPMLAMLGDNKSGKEAIVPLEKAGQMGFGGGGSFTIEVPLIIDGREVARAVAQPVRTELLQTTGRNAARTGLA